MLPVGLTEVIRAPGFGNTEVASWPKEGCSLQKVVLSLDVTLNGRQRARISKPRPERVPPHHAYPLFSGKESSRP